jgi:uracil phosphoribosyltransferase
MRIFQLTAQASVANHFLAEMRHQQIQQDSLRFRRNLERLGEVLAYELSKTLPYKKATVSTPLGLAHTQLLTEQPVLAAILRAGLPLYQGFLNFFDQAESAFVGAYRGEARSDHSFDIEIHYATTPRLDNKVLILIDPMLATGKSLNLVYKRLLHFGQPRELHIVSAIASRAGIQYLEEQVPEASLWVGDIDEELNAKSYIIPGLGDAGDLAFGIKE